MEQTLDHRALYRLPWSLPDNAIAWLEPTSACNLACLGCYRENVPSSHKPMDVVREEIDTFVRLRNTDGISIAGGDPLLHPHIVDIVADIARRGLKPIINTNGLALTKDLLVELKKAGVHGFTFHIDSKQGRPGWRGKNEIELNELRLHYATMLAEVGGLTCAFNSTVYADTLPYIPDMLKWAQEHIDLVHVMVFIAFRQVVPDLPYDYYVGGRKVDMNVLKYSMDDEEEVNITSLDILNAIREVYPDFMPSAYLNGTQKPDSFKWLITARVGTKKRIYGYLGPRFMEFVQTQHHFWRGRYLAYGSPRMMRMGRLALLMSPFDRPTRQTMKAYLASLLTRPHEVFRRLYIQTVTIIQPIDLMEDGAQNMCDGCPDITVWNGKLVWSCRLEEPKTFGTFVQTFPKHWRFPGEKDEGRK